MPLSPGSALEDLATEFTESTETPPNPGLMFPLPSPFYSGPFRTHYPLGAGGNKVPGGVAGVRVFRVFRG